MKITAFVDTADVSEVCTDSIIIALMEATHASETSVYFNDNTQRHIQENFNL
jgi:hypothetical protein